VVAALVVDIGFLGALLALVRDPLRQFLDCLDALQQRLQPLDPVAQVGLLTVGPGNLLATFRGRFARCLRFLAFLRSLRLEVLGLLAQHLGALGFPCQCRLLLLEQLFDVGASGPELREVGLPLGEPLSTVEAVLQRLLAVPEVREVRLQGLDGGRALLGGLDVWRPLDGLAALGTLACLAQLPCLCQTVPRRCEFGLPFCAVLPDVGEVLRDRLSVLGGLPDVDRRVRERLTAGLDVGRDPLEPVAPLRERLAPLRHLRLEVVGRRALLGCGPLEGVGLVGQRLRGAVSLLFLDAQLPDPVGEVLDVALQFDDTLLDGAGVRVREVGRGQQFLAAAPCVLEPVACLPDLLGQSLALALGGLDFPPQVRDIRLQFRQFRLLVLVFLQHCLRVRQGPLGLVAVLLVPFDLRLDLRQFRAERVHLLVEVPVLLGLDLVFEFRESTLLVVAHPPDADPGVARALAVRLEFAQLQQVVDHVLAFVLRRLDELVHLALADVRAVDERLVVHPEQFGHALSRRARPLVDAVRPLENALCGHGPLVAGAHAPFDVVGLAGVREPEFDDGAVGTDGDHVRECSVEPLRSVEGEKRRLQQRRLPAAVEPVDDRHAAVQREVGVRVGLELLQPDPVDPHR